MISTPLPRRDLEFLLYDWLDVTALTTHPHFAEHSRDTFDGLLELCTDIAVNCFAPHHQKADREPPRMRTDGTVEIIDEIRSALTEIGNAGIVAAQFDEAVGGLQVPTVVARAALAIFQAANAATSSYPLLTIANANLLATYGDAEQIDTWVRPMLAGRFFGTMCLSEPGAGSSLADITTRAEPAADGSHRIIGTKMWISGGDHEMADNIVHLVLAKAPGGAPGAKGISLFIVPKYLPAGARNDVALVGLNHKMGNRGTVNTLLNFGEGRYRPAAEPGAVGYLVGEPHRGLHYMLHMMNEARIGVGLLAAAIGYTGYLRSVEYAKSRTQGRSITAREPDRSAVAIIEHSDVKRMLLAQKSYVEGAMALCLYCSKLVDLQRTAPDPATAQRLGLLLEVLTPIAKSWSSQWCLAANDLAIQVHGGYGYSTEFDVEQLYRDNRLNPIHEGTHGIQGLDLLGRKVVMQGGAAFRILVEIISATVQRAEQLEPELAAPLSSALDRLEDVTAALRSGDDRALTLANSTVYLEAAGHVVMAWIWLDKLLTVGDRAGAFYDGKRAAGRFFFRYELPKTGPQFDLLARLDRTTLDADPSWF